MVYYGTYNTEGILWHPAGDMDDMHVILLTKECDEATFTVNVCCYEDWEWRFDMISPAHYEIVKHMIMDLAFECDDMDELIAAMDEMFAEDFAEIVVDDECECDGSCCERCGHRGCLN